jgi:membrane-associated protease RseP (regulator of RpoE activity)
MSRCTLLAALTALGLTTLGATQAVAAPPQLQLKPQGLVVTQVLPGSTAARQGIEVGDVILSVNGSSVRSRTDLNLRLAQAGPVAELGVIDCRTGWQNVVLVYPQFGRIGVDVQTTQPLPPIYPPWDGGIRPQPLPGPGILPTPGMLPTPGVLPRR